MKNDVELDVDARAVIAAGREVRPPTELEMLRVRNAVQRRLAVEAGAVAHPRLGPVKLALALAVVGTGAGAWYAAEKSAVPRAELAAGVPSEQPAVTPKPPQTVALPLPSESPSAAAPVRSSADERAPRPARRSEELAAEIALLAQVNVAINGGDATRALGLLRQYDQRYRPGVLREERAAAGVLALCAAGRVDAARSAAQRFEQRWPHSPLLSRIGASCIRSN